MAINKVIQIAELVREVKEVSLASGRINDLVESATMKVISAEELPAIGTQEAYIRVKFQAGKKSINGSIFALAGLRITDAAGADIVATNSTELRSATNVATLQEYLEDVANKDVDLSLLTFTVIKTVPIVNNFSKVDGEHIYRNDCYEGYASYIQETAPLRANTELTADQRNAAFNIASNKMLGTPVKGNKKLPINLITIPVFRVTK